MTLSIPVHRLITDIMIKRRRMFFASRKRLWPAIILVAGLDTAGLYLLATGAPEAARALPPPPPPAPTLPETPPPPAMIYPPAVADMLQSGTLIVISKPSQHMYVFSDGQLWASTPISTGKKRHATPSGVFPILQKQRYHRSNIYSGAPMPYMQRLTWEGIALHSGWVPGYPASHGCVRLPPAFAQSLFKLTNTSATSVVIGDAPLATEYDAQQFALTAPLKQYAALAPPPDPRVVMQAAIEMADTGDALMHTVIFGANPSVALAQRSSPPAMPVPPPAAPAKPPVAGSQTIQLAAAVSQAEAEAHWTRLLTARPELRRFTKTVEAAAVKSRPVYRLRLSGAEAHSMCVTLKSEGISCFNVS